MNKNFIKLHDFASIAKVVFATLGVFYIIAWVLEFLKFPFMGPVDFFFKPFADFIRIFGTWEIDFQARMVDMTYVIAGTILMLVYPVFSSIARNLNKIMEEREFEDIKRKELDQYNVNKKIEKEYLSEILSYSRFAVLLELRLKPVIDPNLLHSKINIEELRDEDYNEIKKEVSQKYKVECQTINGRIHIIVPDFRLFDQFLPVFLRIVSNISDKNKEREIETNFNLTLDALRSNESKKDSFEFMSKISSFNYKNKAIATGAFSTRYELEDKRKFSTATVGVSRFFEKVPDEKGQSQYIDFELFSLKKRKI